MKYLLFSLCVSSLLFFTGCSFDLTGPAIKTQAFFKGENGDNEWKSRAVTQPATGTAKVPDGAFTMGNLVTKE